MSGSLPATADDKVQIQELLARYAWSFDTGDIEGFVSCFADDATLCEDVFDEVDRWTGSDEIRSMAEHFFAHPGFPGRQHHASQILIEGTAERCRVRAFCFVIEAGEDQPIVRFSGHYEDVVVKRDGRWVFKDRLIRHWSGPILAAFPGKDGVKVPRRRPPG
jgi:uncharacterized protein (TIGR02246 family)